MILFMLNIYYYISFEYNGNGEGFKNYLVFRIGIHFRIKVFKYSTLS